MKGFYNEEARTSKEKVIIASFKGDEDKPRFQLWNKGYDANHDELKPNQEIRGNYCYDTFEKFEGIIDAMDIVDVMIPFQGVPKPFKRLYVIMKVGNEKMPFDIGTYTGRYAQNFLAKMLNPKLVVKETVILAPYHFINENGKLLVGISIFQGVDEQGKPIGIKPLLKEENQALGVPEPDIIETDTGTQWVWGKRSIWMLNYAKNRLLMEGSEFAPDAMTPEDMAYPEPIMPDPVAQEPTKGQIGANFYNPDGESSKKPDPFTSDPGDDLPF